ncbi:MAG: PorV/PorQ family protein [Elusimicrobia bacterium]|nr:PorV/PorQ family protein [Candidatus Liberimonas magnetica]
MKINKEVKHMKIKNIKRLVTGFLSAVLISGLSFAADNTNIAMPLSQEGGTARAMSMGSAVVGMPSLGVASLFWNPAGLGTMGEYMELGVYHNAGVGDTQNDKIAFGMPKCSLGGFAASLNYVDNGTFEGRDSAGNLTSNYTAGDIGGSIGWGKQWVPGFSAGVALKYNQQTLANKAYEAYAATLGVLWNPLNRLNLGLVYANIGTEVVGRRLDSGWRAGASYDVNKKLILALASDLHPDGGLDRVNVGIEDWLDDMVALRAGYTYEAEDNKLDGISGVTVGLGVKVVRDIILDYAYLPYGDLGTSQRISLTYRFSPKKCPEPVKENVVEVIKYVPAPPPPPPVPEHIILFDKVVVLEDSTHFTFDSAVLTSDGKKVVSQNIQILKDHPGATAHIAGYTSCSGAKEYNQKLSERRAIAVKEVLVADGIAPERVSTIGYGENSPAEFEKVCKIIDSKSAKANMRVLLEIRITEK